MNQGQICDVKKIKKDPFPQHPEEAPGTPMYPGTQVRRTKELPQNMEQQGTRRIL